MNFIVSVKGKRFVDVGINQLIQFFGKTGIGKRVTVQFKEGHPRLSVKEIDKTEAPTYWGYSVKERSNLFTLISEWKGSTIITSRKGQATDIEIHANEIMLLKKRLNEIYSKHTGRTVEEIKNALERDKFMTPQEAKEFGLIDKVVERRV